jgi:anaphase-promoting complex subunit 1
MIRLWSHRVYPSALTWDQIQVSVFDSRWDGSTERSLIALCFPITHKLEILSLTRNSDKSHTVSPIRQLKALSAVALRATRIHCRDLLVLDPSLKTVLLTHGLQELPIIFQESELIAAECAPMLPDDEKYRARFSDERLSRFEHPTLDAVSLVYDNGKRGRAAFGLMLPPTSRLPSLVLHLMSITLPHEEFFFMHSHFLQLWASQHLSSIWEVQWHCLVNALYLGFGISPALAPINSQSDSPWLQLQLSRSHRRFDEDSVLAKLKLPVRLPQAKQSSASAIRTSMVGPTVLALHLLGEDLRLNSSFHAELTHLVPVICQLAELIRPEWADYWKRLFPSATNKWPTLTASGEHIVSR